MAALDLRLIDAGPAPELVAYWRLGVGRTAPAQPLRLELLLSGGALSGPMFEAPPMSLGRRLRRLVLAWTGR